MEPEKNDVRAGEKLRAAEEMSPEAFVARAVLPADELREKLLGFMAHEVRNPLASTLWATEMLARRSLGDPRADRLSQLAARSARRLRVLLEDLFALERLPEALPAGEADVRQAMERALGPQDLEPQGVMAPLQGPSGLVAPLNALYLERLFAVCVRRAVRAGDGGPISVTIEEEEGTALISIARAGISAMSMDPALFSPTGSEGGGTAFAMLLARALAQRLGVALWVEEQNGKEDPPMVVMRLRMSAGRPQPH